MTVIAFSSLFQKMVGEDTFVADGRIAEGHCNCIFKKIRFISGTEASNKLSCRIVEVCFFFTANNCKMSLRLLLDRGAKG